MSEVDGWQWVAIIAVFLIALHAAFRTYPDRRTPPTSEKDRL